MSSAVAILSHVRIAFRKPKPPSPWRVVAFAIVVVSLGWVAKSTLLLLSSRSAFDHLYRVLVITVWGIVYATWRQRYRKIREIERRTGMAISPSSSEFRFYVAYVCFTSFCLVLPPW